MFFLALHNQQAALLRKEKKRIVIEKLEVIEPNVKPLYTYKPLQGKKTIYTVTGLSTEDVLLRSLSLELSSKQKILATLPFQANRLVPYPIEETILLPRLYPKGKHTEIFFLASSTKSLENHLELCSLQNVDPDVVSCVPQALYRFAMHFFPKEQNLFVQHNDHEKSTFIVIKNKILVASFSFSQEQEERMWTYAHKNYPEVPSILFTKDPSPCMCFIEKKIPNPTLQTYAIPIGLALDAAYEDAQTVQFRQKQYMLKKWKTKEKHLLYCFLSACTFFILTCLITAHIQYKKREKSILESLKISENTSLKKAVVQLEKSLHKQKPSRLQQNTHYRVSDVLLWLSKHPVLSKDSVLTQITYKTRNSLTQVTIHVKIENQDTAQKFYKSLKKDHTFVHQKYPIKWKEDNGCYQACFYLAQGGLRK